jgi:hypothetical protein
MPYSNRPLSWVRSPDVGDASSANSINRQAIIVWVSELKAHRGFDASRPWEIKPGDRSGIEVGKDTRLSGLTLSIGTRGGEHIYMN